MKSNASRRPRRCVICGAAIKTEHGLVGQFVRFGREQIIERYVRAIFARRRLGKIFGNLYLIAGENALEHGIQRRNEETNFAVEILTENYPLSVKFTPNAQMSLFDSENYTVDEGRSSGIFTSSPERMLLSTVFSACLYLRVLRADISLYNLFTPKADELPDDRVGADVEYFTEGEDLEAVRDVSAFAESVKICVADLFGELDHFLHELRVHFEAKRP